MKLKGLRFFLSPVSILWAAIARLHRLLYATKILSRIHLPVRVVSVGNLLMGGAGKTPVVLELAKQLTRKGVSVGIVCRSYKSQLRKAQKVENVKNGAEFFGDEAWIYFTKLENVPIYSGPCKADTAKLLSDNEKVQIILIDDGFQHHRLQRDFDLVLVDISRDYTDHRVFPWGMAREDANVLSQADFVALTKREFANATNAKNWIELTERFSKKVSFTRWKTILPKNFSATEVYLMSGLADNDGFKKSIEKIGISVRDHLCFSDHHLYTSEELQGILSKLKKDIPILTTDKDYVKIKDLSFEKSRIFTVEITVELDNELLHQIIG